MRVRGQRALVPVLALAVAVAIATACDARAPIASCTDSLDGAWATDTRGPSGQPVGYHIIDRGNALEMYPTFDDSYPPDGAGGKLGPAVWTPATFDFQRGPDASALVGTEQRRGWRDGAACTFRRSVRLRACRGDTITLVGPAIAGIDWEQCVLSTGAEEALILRRL